MNSNKNVYSSNYFNDKVFCEQAINYWLLNINIENRGCSCVLFDKENYFILSGGSNKEIKLFDKDGDEIDSIRKSDDSCYSFNFIEATYLNKKPYILLCLNDYSECYDYKDRSSRKYKPKQNKGYHNDINLFNNNKRIYLIVSRGYDVVIFDFESTNEISSIKVNEKSYFNGLCSLNEKYILVGDDKEIRVLNFDSKSFIKNYKDFTDESIQGIEKINVPNEGVIIVCYTENIISFWK